MSTIYRIGKDLGVSPMTVSNALNYRKGVGEKTAIRIREYAQKIGYRPSHMARALSNGRTGMIGLCLRDTPRNAWLAGMMDEMNQAVRAEGYSLNIMLTNGELGQIRAALRQLAEHRVEATVIGPLGYTHEYIQLAEDLKQLPNVLAFEAVDNLPVDHCMVDVYQGGLLAMRHLFDLGHRQIGYIGAVEMETKTEGVRNRYAAYTDSLAHQRIAFEPQWVITQEQCSFDVNDQSTYQLVQLFRRLEELDKLPTALFCHNDWIAAQVVRALQEIGLSVPHDISVIGFDNQQVCNITFPTITSVGFDLKEYVRSIAQLVFNRLDQKAGEGDTPVELPMVQRLVIQPQLHIRRS
ncbi:MAG: LacI family DNA-binding transcriptional regulator, partial [Phycisphaeraceae bacterium JB051]